jgi:hypothetical protein
VQKLVEDFRAVGLEVNQGKCELIILNHSREESSKLRCFGGCCQH